MSRPFRFAAVAIGVGAVLLLVGIVMTQMWLYVIGAVIVLVAYLVTIVLVLRDQEAQRRRRLADLAATRAALQERFAREHDVEALRRAVWPDRDDD